MAVTKFEVASVPVSDQDRAKQFYAGQLGFTEQIDAGFGESMRWVMLRPPGSGTSITLVTWFESMPPGSLKGSVLGCDDLEKTLDELSARGVSFNEAEIQQTPWGRWKTFDDPDGNGWVLQQTNPDFAGSPPRVPASRRAGNPGRPAASWTSGIPADRAPRPT